MTGTLVSSQIAEPYAQALMSLAEDRNLTDYFGDELRGLGDLLAQSAELSSLITNPVVADEQKKDVLRQIMGDCDPALRHFLMLLVDKRRIIFLATIIEEYLNLLRALKQIALAEVTVCQDPTGSQREAIEQKVRSFTNAQGVELKITVDPSILGGVIIRVGSQVLDASLQGQLRRIGMQLNA
ncbi:MAG: F0F1 ATP synthase subunit delta [Spirulina sp. DLM2.Bin59]|nr:MAG: F0F1 ATP synthase subunit delta [Spirulina sp. DLM2.Bin59]